MGVDESGVDEPGVNPRHVGGASENGCVYLNTSFQYSLTKDTRWEVTPIWSHTLVTILKSSSLVQTPLSSPSSQFDMNTPITCHPVTSPEYTWNIMYIRTYTSSLEE